MKSFSSLTAVIGLWLGVSFGLWLAYRFIRRRDHGRQRKLLEDALRLIEEAHAIFASFRNSATSSSLTATYYQRPELQGEEALRDNVRRLLNAIEASSGFFDRVNSQKKKLQNTFKIDDFEPLSEILQIRRDFWAASEVFLMDDIRVLGAELADETAYEGFRQEAKTLLFGDDIARLGTGGSQDDPVELRLTIAHEQANAFIVEADRVIASQREQDRLPTTQEMFGGPWRLIRTTFTSTREIRYLIADAVVTAQILARAMTSKGLKGAAEELRRVRGDLPGQFAAAFERAGGLARQGGQGLKRHYEFLLEAQELRARYAELLAKAPDLSEKGKQFLARLELEKKAEQFRETSEGLLAWSRQQIVVAIAYLIRGLQFVQAKITPVENKQLVLRSEEQTTLREEPTSPRKASSAKASDPIRVLLLPASNYEAGKGNGRPPRRGGSPRSQGFEPEQKTGVEEVILFSGLSETPKDKLSTLRRVVKGKAGAKEPKQSAPKEHRADDESAKTKSRFSHTDGIMKTSFKDLLASAEGGHKDQTISLGRASLLDRLAAIDHDEAADDSGNEAHVEENAPAAKTSSKKSGFRLFKSKRR